MNKFTASGPHVFLEPKGGAMGFRVLTIDENVEARETAAREIAAALNRDEARPQAAEPAAEPQESLCEACRLPIHDGCTMPVCPHRVLPSRPLPEGYLEWLCGRHE